MTYMKALLGPRAILFKGIGDIRGCNENEIVEAGTLTTKGRSGRQPTLPIPNGRVVVMNDDSPASPMRGLDPFPKEEDSQPEGTYEPLQYGDITSEDVPAIKKEDTVIRSETDEDETNAYLASAARNIIG